MDLIKAGTQFRMGAMLPHHMCKEIIIIIYLKYYMVFDWLMASG